MKIHKVILHNIASFADATVDFDAEPLASTDVFLITGRVGSGKSTILDAISLALFGVTPRLQAQRAVQAYGSFENAGVTTPRQILRSGCAEGRAELLFEAGGVEYRAMWKVDRSRANGANELTDLSSNHVYTGGEAVAAVERILCMTFDQFCRTTLLAQGEFARFLKSDDNGKSLILQRLIGEDIYERVGRAISVRKRNADAEYKAAKALYDRVKPMTGEEEKEKRRELKAVRDRLKELKVEAERLSTEATWVKQAGVLADALAVASKEYGDARADCDSDKTKLLRATVADYARTADVRTECRRLKSLRAELDAGAKSLGRCAAEARSLAAGVDALGLKIKDCEAQTVILDEAQAVARVRKPLYDAVATLRTLVVNLQTAEANAKASRTDSATRQKTLDEVLVPEAEKATAKAQEAQATLAATDKEVDNTSHELEAAGVAVLRDDLARVNARIADVRDVGRDIEAVARLSDEVRSLNEQCEAEKKSLAELDGAVPALRELCRQSLAALERVRHNRDVAFEGLNDRIESLRAMLRQGDVCPVCGAAVDAELPVSEAVKAAVDELDRAVAEMQAVHDANGLKLSKTLSDHENVGRNIERFDADIKRKRHDCAALVESLAARWQALIGSGEPDKSVLEVEASRLRDEVERLSKLITAAEAIEKRLAELRSRQTSERRLSQKADALRQKAVDDLTACRAEVERLGALADAADIAVTKTREQLLQVVADCGGCVADCERNIASYVDGLCAEKEAFEAREANLAERQKALEALRRVAADASAALVDLNAVAEGIEALDDKSVECCVNDEVLATEVRSLTVRMRTLANECESRKAESRAAQEAVDAFVAANPEMSEARIRELDSLEADYLDSVTASLRQKDERVAAASGAVGQCRAGLDEHRKSCPPSLCAVADDALPPLEQIEKLRAGVDVEMLECQALAARIERLIENNKELKDKRKLLREDKDRKDAVLANWKVLDNMFGTSDGKRFRTIALSYVLGGLIERANRYMQALTDRYRLIVHPGTFIILVEDAYQGYTRRPATSISGGESFIVSLSLALALSDISEVSGADILFIDEGFGSLSGQELDNAIAMLQNLHSLSRRRVGIISHLPRVSESLPVQIRVSRATPLSPSTLDVTVGFDGE